MRVTVEVAGKEAREAAAGADATSADRALVLRLVRGGSSGASPDGFP